MRNNANNYTQWLKNTRGMTLVELLATLLILSMIIGIMYTVVESGMLAFKRTEGETLLREEGDYIMSKVIYAFYRSGANNVQLDPSAGSDVEQTLRINGVGGQYMIETEVVTTDGHDHLNILITEPGATAEKINQERYVLDNAHKIFELQECTKEDSTNSPCTEGIIKVSLTWRKALAETSGSWYKMESSFGF